MKMIRISSALIAMITMVTFMMNVNTASAQTDTVTTSPKDTTAKVESTKDKKSEKRRKDEFLVYIGANFNQLTVSSSVYESAMKPGYHFGGAYKRGKFFYWEAGARFNHAQYGLTPVSAADTSATFGVNSIDIPVTGGMNLLYFMNRIVALRLFVSAVPSFAIGISDNDLDLKKADMNSFGLYARGGLGINVAFFILEAGYNYGFTDVFKTAETKPGQIFINLGFRF